VGLPLLAGGAVRGVIEYFPRGPRPPAPETIEMMGTLAAQVGRFLTILSDRTQLVERFERLSLTDELTGPTAARGTRASSASWHAHTEKMSRCVWR